jgi:uncharacterized UPF0160 family protein
MVRGFPISLKTCYIQFVFNFLKPKITVVTHNGTFHADEVFACATLSIWAEKNGKRLKVVRTRNPEIIARADMVVDVGNTYDPNKNRFDHHQKEGAGTHNNGIPYASFGLIWKYYGGKICTQEVAEMIEKNIVIPIDARDNGINITKITELGIADYRVSNAISSFNPTQEEEEGKSHKQFIIAVGIAKQILEREIIWETEARDGARVTREAIEEQNEPEILVLENRIESEEEVSKHKNIKFIISKSKANENWSVIAARDNLEDYNSDRASFPEGWRGLRDEDLIKVSGVNGAIFCHKGGWFAKAKTKEAAIELARIALRGKNVPNSSE